MNIICDVVKKNLFLDCVTILSLSLRYDIKGCEVGRWTDPASTGSPVKILKDNNFEGKHIILGKSLVCPISAST